MLKLQALFPVVLVPAFALLASACSGDADRALRKPKSDGDARVAPSVTASDPSAEHGWTLHDRAYETAHPYENFESQVFTITHPGASEVRVRFTDFETENAYDWVKVSTPEGGSAIWYTGKLGDFWTKSIPGSSVRIELVTDHSVTQHGFRIAGYATKADVESWETGAFTWRTEHPYADDAYQVIEIAEPRAIKMKLLFGEFSTEEGYDFVHVYNESGMLIASYSGELGRFETAAFEGRKLYVAFVSDGSITDHGVAIEAYSFVSEESEPGCMCMALYAPVCGENGKTYGNSCEAACEEVAVAHEGECGTAQGDFCGGIAGFTCSEGWTCELDGDYPDAGGTCVAEGDET